MSSVESDLTSTKRPRDEEAIDDELTALEAKRQRRELKFTGRNMPPNFQQLLGQGFDVVPDEAKDLEDTTLGHEDFVDLPATRQTAVKDAVQRLCDRANKLNNDTLSKEMERMVMRASRISGIGGTAKKSEMTAAYRLLLREGRVQPNPVVEQFLIRKKGKSHSGVLVITVFMGPGEFSCPKDCHYCPNQPGVARSYLLKEPGVLRGFRNQWDPISQFFDRASALENNGHVVDKIELIILGGTFSFYPKQYVEDFMRASFYAANTYYERAPLREMRSLQEEITLNETANCRIIGVTAETRPDYITNAELRRFRNLGITRVQLGIQHLDDDILNLINRECPTAKTVVAIKRLLDAGFKVDAHWMPDLPGSSYKKDREMFELLFSADNQSFQVDQWKVYPTATVPFTVIKQWYEEGRYKPYAELENGRYMVELLLYIMQECPYRIRLNRIIRDIPTTYISGGEKRCNLRQIIETEMKVRGVRCKDIRERECKGAPMDRTLAELFVDEFRASDGTELYISIEMKDRSSLFGHLRLRLRDRPTESIVAALDGAALIRELHTYGKLVKVAAVNSGKGEAQHMGVGTELMKTAERIAKERGFLKTAVIAGVGVRKYYEKLGYRLQDTYMVKDLTESAPISDEQVQDDDDNENPQLSVLQGVASAVASAVSSAVSGFIGSFKKK